MRPRPSTWMTTLIIINGIPQAQLACQLDIFAPPMHPLLRTLRVRRVMPLANRCRRGASTPSPKLDCPPRLPARSLKEHEPALLPMGANGCCGSRSMVRDGPVWVETLRYHSETGSEAAQ